MAASGETWKCSATSNMPGVYTEEPKVLGRSESVACIRGNGNLHRETLEAWDDGVMDSLPQRPIDGVFWIIGSRPVLGCLDFLCSLTKLGQMGGLGGYLLDVPLVASKHCRDGFRQRTF